MHKKIVVLSGDGIGPEVTLQALKVLQSIANRFNHQFEFQNLDFGAVSIRKNGVPLTEEVLNSCKSADAILLGAVGHPEFGPSAKVRPEQGLLELRKSLGLYMNLRPVKVYEGMLSKIPLREEIVRGTDILFVRELTGGIYFGEKIQEKNFASDLCFYTKEEIERIALRSFQIATQRRKKLCLIDKANVLATSRLWREVVAKISDNFPEVEFSCMYVDNAAMQLIINPQQFDVVLTENMFGDILTDEASVLAGSLGILPSASCGKGPSLYEPIHGSWPEAEGKDKACPIGSILSVAMMLEHSFGLELESALIHRSVQTLFHSSAESKNDVSVLKMSCSEIGNRLAQLIFEYQLEEV